MAKPVANITVGISGSGKTTWAKAHAQEHGAIITCRDDLRFALTGANGWGEYKFKKQIEDMVTELQWQTAKLAYLQGRDLIVADTNLNEARRNNLVADLKHLGFEVQLQPMHITLEEAFKRNTLRNNGVSREIVYRQWKDWLKFIGRRVYEPAQDYLPKAVIFDIDGTLAHMNGRSAYAWDKVGTDTVDEHIRMIQWAYACAGYRIIVVSGRDGSCQAETEKWLQDHHIGYDVLFMRQADDQRKDTVVKEEIFWNNIADAYNVEVVFDDRPCVVRMWHDIGIPKVIAVADQNIEF